MKIPTRKMAMEEEDSGGLGKKMDIHDIIFNMENSTALLSAVITSDFIYVCYLKITPNFKIEAHPLALREEPRGY